MRRFLAALVLALVLTAVGRADDLAAVFASLDGGQPSPATVRLITDGEEAWYARWWLLEHAERTIDTTCFTRGDDVFGRAYLGLLLKKAKQGVRIRLMIDARGSSALARHDYLQELAAVPQVQIRVYNPISRALLRLPDDLREVLAASQDKLILVDDRYLLTGGRNIAASFFGRKTDNPDVSRDPDILIRGGAAPSSGRRAFDEQFTRPDNRAFRPDGPYDSRAFELEIARAVMQSHLEARPAPAPETLADAYRSESGELSPFRNLASYASYEPFQSGPVPSTLLDAGSPTRTTPPLESLLDAACSEILIQNPYVVLTDRIRACLARAAARGVRITLNTNSPDSTDALLTQALFLREWKPLMATIPTLRIHALRGDHHLHAKLFVLDNRVTILAPYNLDPLSDRPTPEALLLVDDPTFARLNHDRIDTDLADSVEYTIRKTEDGTIEQVTGPSTRVAEEALRRVDLLGKLAFLRPLI